MKYNRLGDTGLLVSELSFGSWVTFSEKGQVSKEELAFDIMRTAYEGGVNFFDNAELYSHGEAETLMGKAIQIGIDRKVWIRDDLIVSTKIFFGALVPENHPDFIKHGKTMNRIGLSRKHIVEGLKASLKRMNLDYVDIAFCHRFDPLANVEEIVRSFNYLIDQGLCFYWGTSEWTAQEIQEARGIAEKLNMVGPSCDQPQYNMFHRNKIEIEYARLYPKVGLTTWSPLAYGVLTGKYKDGVPAGSRMALDMFKDSSAEQRFKDRVAKTEKLRPIAEKLDCTLAQLALAWCIANPNVSTVIGGATSVKQIEENLGAIKVVDKLTPTVMGEIDAILETKPDIPEPTAMAARIRNKVLRHEI